MTITCNSLAELFHITVTILSHCVLRALEIQILNGFGLYLLEDSMSGC